MYSRGSPLGTTDESSRLCSMLYFSAESLSAALPLTQFSCVATMAGIRRWSFIGYSDL